MLSFKLSLILLAAVSLASPLVDSLGARAATSYRPSTTTTSTHGTSTTVTTKTTSVCCSSFCGAIPTPTSLVTSTKRVTPSAATVTITAVATITASPVIITAVIATVTAFSTRTFIETTTITSTGTTTVSVTTTSATQLTCLSSAYVAADHPPTIGGNVMRRGYTTKQPVHPTSTTGCKCTTPAAKTSTITVTTTLPVKTSTVTATRTTTTIPTRTLDITSRTTSIVSVTFTTTVTSSTFSTTTTTVTATATSLARNGITYRRYTSGHNADVEYLPQYPAYELKAKAPVHVGQNHDVTYQTEGSPFDPYLTLDDDRFSFRYGAIVMQGFFVADQSGSYSIFTESSTVDNWNSLWGNANNAYSWPQGTESYTASRTTSSDSNWTGGSYNFTLSAGDAIPMTWLFANGRGGGISAFYLLTPDGNTRTVLDGYLIQPCDGSPFT